MKFSDYNIFIKDNDGTYILTNTFTGSMFRIDEDVKNKIKNNNIEAFNDKDIEDYKKSGIIIDNEIDEKKYLDYMLQKSKFTTEILSITLLLTDLCNLRCIYCYEGAGEYRKDTLEDTTRENIFKFIKNQIDKTNARVLSLVLFGGEPLLFFNENFKWLKELKYMCENNKIHFQTMIITNGVLITDDILDQLININCKYIQITLDGIEEIHNKRRMYKGGKGSYIEVLKGIKLAYSKRDNFNLTIRINIDKENYNQTFELLEILKREGLVECSIDFGIVKGGTEACSSYSNYCFEDEEIGDILLPLWEKLEELGFKINTSPTRKTTYCGLYNENSFTISPKGDVYKCWELVGDEEHLIGKINNEGEISSITYKYFDWMAFDPLKIPKCEKCKYLPVCGGGCGAVSYEKYKTYHSNGCFKVKGIFEKQILRKAKLN